jgi:ATP-dependent DNA ligase
MGLEGIVSKRMSAPYRSGPSRDWIKVKNPDSPAMVRHRKGAGKSSARSWIEAQRGEYCRRRSELGKA